MGLGARGLSEAGPTICQSRTCRCAGKSFNEMKCRLRHHPPAAAAAACPASTSRFASLHFPQPPRKPHVTKILPHITGLRTDEQLREFLDRGRQDTVRSAAAEDGWEGARADFRGCCASLLACTFKRQPSLKFPTCT